MVVAHALRQSLRLRLGWSRVPGQHGLQSYPEKSVIINIININIIIIKLSYLSEGQKHLMKRPHTDMWVGLRDAEVPGWSDWDWRGGWAVTKSGKKQRHGLGSYLMGKENV